MDCPLVVELPGPYLGVCILQSSIFNMQSNASDSAPRPLHATGANPFSGRAVTVMGLGLFGGGVGAARYLASRGARVTVTDTHSAEALKPSLQALEGLPITYHLGGHIPADFTDADLVVVNPAVDKAKSEFVALARKARVKITSEMNLFMAACPAPVVGITGSNGKSTTTALLGEMLRRQRPTRVGGNIGRSLLDELDVIAPDEAVVLELSSFQLEDLGLLRKSPRVAIVTNITPNHLDRHGTMRAYIAAKKNILRFQGAGDAAVLNADDRRLRLWEKAARARGSRVVLYSARRELPDGVFADGTVLVFRLDGREERVDLAGRITLFGKHNLMNILAAAAGARVMGVPPQSIAEAVAAFRPLVHRLEPIGRIGDVLLVNDSKATTPLAAKAAIESFDQPISLIAGGYDKHIDPAPMVSAIRRRVQAVVLVGQTAEALEQAIGRRRRPVVERVETFEAAVRRAVALAPPGGVVLLSTGHASWGMFDNYERRGETFRQVALTLGMAPLEVTK
jgi:UDP-N-acetylmuramoylalanine--D-glutamate ligase